MIERMVSIEELDEGMLITADVYTRGGVIIVPENTVVTAEVLNLLARHSIMEVIVGEEGESADANLSTEDLDILQDALGMLDYLEERENKQESFEETFQKAAKNLEESLMKIVNGETFDVYQLLDIVDTIAAKADNDVNLMDMLFKMSRNEADLYVHCLKVSIYGQLLANGWICRRMRLNWPELPDYFMMSACWFAIKQEKKKFLFTVNMRISVVLTTWYIAII